MRLFIAINFGEETLEKLEACRDGLKDRSESGGFTLTENLHLTLVFIGECDEKQMRDVVSAMNGVRFEPFDLSIDRIGRFKRDSGEIWWAGVRKNNQLLELQRELTDRLIAAGFDLEKRNYSPHVTLGRKVITKAVPENIETFGERVFRMDLMKSERISGKLTYTAVHTKESGSSI